MGCFITVGYFSFILSCITSPIFPSSPAFLILVNHLFFFSDLYLCDHFHLRPAILSYILFYPSPQIILPMFVLVETSRLEMLDAMEIICLQNVLHHLAGDVAPGCIFSVSRIVSLFPHAYGNRCRPKSRETFFFILFLCVNIPLSEPVYPSTKCQY